MQIPQTRLMFNTSMLSIGIMLTVTTTNATTNLTEIDQQQHNQYQHRVAQLEAEQHKQPQVHLNQPNKPNIDQITTNENPCFVINQLHLDLPDTINNTDKRYYQGSIRQLTTGQNNILGQCIGQRGLAQINDSIQNQLLKQGYITTQASIPPQELNTGILHIRITAGKVGDIRLGKANSKNIHINNAIVSQPDDILNLKDIETSLENLRRPNSVNSTIDIVPSDRARDDYAYSDLIVHYQQNNPLSLQFSIDDSGSTDTGKYQGSLSATVDNPLNFNDILNLSFTHSIDPWNNTETDTNNNNLYASYLIPFRQWQLNLSHSRYNFQQTLAGLNDDIIYSGKSNQTKINLERLLHRNRTSQTWLDIGGYHKCSKNYFDKEEIEVQRKQTSGWTLALKHNRQTNFGNINAEIGYRKGTGAFSAIPSPESYISNAQSQPSILTANLQLNYPFQLGQGDYHYKMNWQGQYTKDELTSQDRFAIGGRYSIKGTNDEKSLSGENGILLQQELARTFALNNKIALQPYLTFDQGVVGGASTHYLSGTQLVGTSVRLRIFSDNLSLDGFVGKSIKAPEHIGNDTQAGFKLSILY